MILPPKAIERKLSDLVSSNQVLSYFAPGNINLDPDEEENDTCLTIDVPGKLFNQIAPTKDDLFLSSHGRAYKKNDNDDETSFSVIVANRLPIQGQKTTVHLVSLEGMEHYLPDDSNHGTLTESQILRLVSLYSWSFTPVVEKESFKTYLLNLDMQPPTPQLPVTEDTDSRVASAFSMGYVALTHHTRIGSKTVSWYRGPLLPMKIPKQPFEPILNADQAQRYNPETGLLDGSYASAWQIGRLLGLQNQSFAVALNNWRRNDKRSEWMKEEQALIDDTFANILNTKNSQLTSHEVIQQSMDFVKNVLHPHVAKTLGKKVSEPGEVRVKPLKLNDPETPKVVSNFLKKLALLHGVAFDYLIPHENMLPQESLRFFQLDPNWITYLLDGALSVGRSSHLQLSTDKKLFSAHHSAAGAGQLTGFIIRSDLIAGWPKLQVDAYDKNGKDLPILRKQNLSKTVLFVLVDGPLFQVDIHEAAQGLHFGVEENDASSSFKVHLKSLSTGAQLNDFVPVVLRPNGRTVNMHSTQLNIRKGLPSNETKQFTVAEFALEMIEGVQRVSFVNE